MLMMCFAGIRIICNHDAGSWCQLALLHMYYLLKVFDKIFIVLLNEMYLNTSKDDIDVSMKRWQSLGPLEDFNPDKEDIEAKDPSWVVRQLKDV